MKLRHVTFATLTLLGSPCARAQVAAPKSPPSPVLEVIRKFNEQKAAKPNEVTVILDPVGSSPAANRPAAPAAPADPATTAATAIPPADSPSVVTTPPADSPPAATIPPASIEPSASKPPPGVAVHVENLQRGTGMIDPTQVKLHAPFPAKPITPAPAGWLLQPSESAPPFTRVVELSPGNPITLTVRPHLLVPVTDDATVFMVPEPGFEPALGYRQNATVGAILARSIRQLDDDSKDLGTAIDQLQQILVSLPKAPPQPEPRPQAKPAATHKR